MSKILSISLFLVLTSLSLCAQDQIQDEEEKKIFFELRPIQFLLEGYSIVGHYAINDRMQLGASIFAATLSEGITDFVWDTQGPLGLEARQDVVFGISYRYFLSQDKYHHGWFLGAAGGGEFYTLTNQDDGQELDYTFYYVAPRIGYIWRPFRKKIPNFYLSMEAVVVFPLIGDGQVNFVSGGTAEINSILPSPLLGIGYRF